CSWSTSPGSGGRAATGFGSVTTRVCRSGSTPTSTPTCAAARWRNFYHNRSRVPIEAEYVGAAHGPAGGGDGVAPRDGGLPGGAAPNQADVSVGCVPGACPEGERYDVRGGWYDAGDHGKYVVNGALAAWQLIDSFEESGDVALRIPEHGGELPDLLAEARWQLEFLLRMQRADGLVFHKIHDAAWTGLPLAPAADPQP